MLPTSNVFQRHRVVGLSVVVERVKHELLAEIGLGYLGDRQRRGVSHVVRVDGQSGRELARRDRRVLLDVPAQSLFS